MTKLLFVTTHPDHASAKRRIRAFKKAGADITLNAIPVDKSRPDYFKRLPDMVRLANGIRKAGDADLVWAWGLDSSLVASLACLGRSVPLIWDISDLLPLQVEERFGWNRPLRRVERSLIPRANHVLLTSPAFYDEYYSAWLPRSRVSVIENLLDGDTLPSPQEFDAMRTAHPERKLRVVYAGIFRSLRLLNLLLDPASNPDGNFEFHLHGVCCRDLDPEILKRFDGTQGRFYHGPYSDPGDLPRIYANADLVFSLLDIEADANERYLLPNRFYHSGYFGIPALGTRGSFLGQCIEEENLGLTTDNNPTALSDTLAMLHAPGHLQEMRRLLPKPGRFVASDEYQQILQVVAGRKRFQPPPNDGCYR